MSHLKAEHQRLKTLQQRIVKLACDARPLVDPLFQAHVEFLRDLMEAVPVPPPEHQEERRRG
jgi:hypothetical protein